MIVSATHSLAMVVDIQERLVPNIYENEKMVKNMQTLIDGLKLFDIPFLVNEQYPKGLGSTIKPIKDKLQDTQINEKLSFSCCGASQTKEKILKSKKNTAIVFGIETHVCVMQTCLELLANNFSPVLVVDCCGSRKLYDHEIAIQRMIQAGVTPTTYEALLFELCKTSDSQLFKQMSKLVK